MIDTIRKHFRRRILPALIIVAILVYGLIMGEVFP